MSDNLTAAGIRHRESGKPWRGIDPTKKGVHWKFTVRKLEELAKEDRLHFPKKTGGVPRYKRYFDEVHFQLLHPTGHLNGYNTSSGSHNRTLRLSNSEG